MTGSTTKAFTAAAAALLVHDASYPDVKWESPIQEFIREDFALQDEHATSHTTIEDALSHRTGLPGHDLIGGQLNDTPSAIVQRMRYLPMTAEPRALWQYCNNMYAVITDLLETITGQNLETILADNFWKPLGMLSTTFTNPLATSGSESSHLARGYYWNAAANVRLKSDCKGEYVPEPYDDNSANPGAGAIFSTVNDYALWVQALLDAAESGKPSNLSSPITPSIFRDLMSPRSIVSEIAGGQDPNYGFITPPLYALGWFTVQIRGETIVIHDGVQTGFGANVYMLPEKGYGIITMANTAYTSNVAGGIIASRLLLQKLNATGAREESVLAFQESLMKISRSILRPPVTKNRRQSPFPKLWTQTSQAGSLPLPRSITDFAGLYSHPAYGPINLTVVTSQTTLPSEILEGLIYPRVLPRKIQLFHITDTVFAVKSFSPHGLGDIVTGKDIVWEDDSEDEKALFTLGLDSEVETMGIEIEDSMVDMAREKGVKHWKEGMIWFEKI